MRTLKQEQEQDFAVLSDQLEDLREKWGSEIVINFLGFELTKYEREQDEPKCRDCGILLTPVYETYGEPENARQELDHWRCGQCRREYNNKEV